MNVCMNVCKLKKIEVRQGTGSIRNVCMYVYTLMIQGLARMYVCFKYSI